MSVRRSRLLGMPGRMRNDRPVESLGNPWPSDGFSGPVSLQASLHWNAGDTVTIEINVSGLPTTTVGLHDIVVLPSGEAWAVGSVKAREPFAVRWDGEGFVRIATADLGVDAEWLGVGGSPEGGVWAVGKRTDGLRYRTLVARADGDRFVVVPSPNQGEGNDVLSDVDVAGEVAWAVGWTYGADARFHPLTMRLADGAWGIVAAPAPLDVVVIDDEAIAPIYEASLVLVRPDMHVAWRGNGCRDGRAVWRQVLQ